MGHSKCWDCFSLFLGLALFHQNSPHVLNWWNIFLLHTCQECIRIISVYASKNIWTISLWATSACGLSELILNASLVVTYTCFQQGSLLTWSPKTHFKITCKQGLEDFSDIFKPLVLGVGFHWNQAGARMYSTYSISSSLLSVHHQILLDWNENQPFWNKDLDYQWCPNIVSLPWMVALSVSQLQNDGTHFPKTLGKFPLFHNLRAILNPSFSFCLSRCASCVI